MHPITPQTGGTPDPGDVVGRDKKILQIIKGCQEGTNFIVSDPRRMGKTAMLIRLCDSPGKGIDAVKIDLEGADTNNEVVRRILAGIRRHASFGEKAFGAIRNFIDDVSIEKGGVKLSATARAMTPLAALERALESIDKCLDEGELLIIAVDEVTKALENIAKRDPKEAALLLQTLRRLRSQPSGIRWILTGSVGFHHIIRKAGETEGVMAEAEILDLGPLDSRYAEELTIRLFLGIDRKPESNDVIERLVKRTSGIPFLLHNAVRHLAGSDSRLVTIAQADEAYDSYVNDRTSAAPITHLLTRLRPYYIDREALAKKVLDTLAIKPMTFVDLIGSDATTGVERDALLDLVDDLVDDHYLAHSNATNDILEWRYEALCEIWRIRRRL